MVGAEEDKALLYKQIVSRVVDTFWQQYWENLEELRWSNESKRAYESLKRILKYNLFQKRDGSIVNSVLLENGEISSDQDVVNASLAQTIREIQVNDVFEWLDVEPFPKLPSLTISEMDHIIGLLSTDKAVSYDCTSDAMFSVQVRKFTAQKLNNIWSYDFDADEHNEKTWTSRLIALNKVYPKTPLRTQFRPINVGSALLKLLEARFLPKLKAYLSESLDRCQTGFVDGMGTQVNVWRAISRIKLRFASDRPCFGLFLDFANAYNFVPHVLLFKKLEQKGIFSPLELSYLKCIYSRLRVKIGKQVIRYNRGVAQGSILSPALFNIFIEDLSEELRDKGGVSLEDLLFYADDVCILCSSPTQLRICIKVVEDWAERNGMVLNKKKSGIVVFTRRLKRNIFLRLGTVFAGYLWLIIISIWGLFWIQN